MKVNETERKEDIAELRKMLKPGSKVYCTVTHVSRSGMSRSIALYIVRKGEIVSITHYIKRILGYPFDQTNGGVKVSGCGMDMGFHTVYSLSRALYPKGFKLPKGMWHNHSKPGEHCNDGGYALRKEWL